VSSISWMACQLPEPSRRRLPSMAIGIQELTSRINDLNQVEKR
jgi:hypothetical protein